MDGNIIYQYNLSSGLIISPFSSLEFIKEGGTKIPAKVGKTIMEPIAYHGILLPHRVLNLSLMIPAIGVKIPSVN